MIQYARRCLMLLLLLTASEAVAGEAISWLSLSEGMTRARIEKKPMIVDFYFGAGCPRCVALQKEVYDDPAISRRVMRDFVPIRIDLTRKLTAEEKKLGAGYDYKNDCLLLFLDSEGGIIKEPGGRRLCFINAVDPESFARYLDMITAGTGT